MIFYKKIFIIEMLMTKELLKSIFMNYYQICFILKLEKNLIYIYISS